MTQTAEILESLHPRRRSTAGWHQFDLARHRHPLVINWNRFDAVSALLDATLEQYEGAGGAGKRTCPPSSPKWRG